MDASVWVEIIVIFFAGMGAGLGTGFAGMSAAAVIAPMLTVFLGVDSYVAVGIALASDVLASAVSAITYGRNKNLDIKNGLVMMVTVLLFTILGSYLGSLIEHETMGSISVFMTILVGIRFIAKPVMTSKESFAQKSKRAKIIQAIVSGAIVGLICGFVGAGGGMMMLFLLITVLGYDLKTAVGTSVFIMTFTALVGAGSHFVLGDSPDWLMLVLCAVFTLIWAQIAALIANKVSPKLLNRITGIALTVLGVAMLVFTVITKYVLA